MKGDLDYGVNIPAHLDMALWLVKP